MRHFFHICMIAAIVWGIISWMKQPSIHTAPGVLAAEDPAQAECEPHVVAQVKDYTITAVASYLIHARVLHTKHYWADGNDLVVPMDDVFQLIFVEELRENENRYVR